MPPPRREAGALGGHGHTSSVRPSALTRKPRPRKTKLCTGGTPGHMRLPHRLQGQKVKSQGHGAGAYCGGHLAAHLVSPAQVSITCFTTMKETALALLNLAHPVCSFKVRNQWYPLCCLASNGTNLFGTMTYGG